MMTCGFKAIFNHTDDKKLRLKLGDKLWTTMLGHYPENITAFPLDAYMKLNLESNENRKIIQLYQIHCSDQVTNKESYESLIAPSWQVYSSVFKACGEIINCKRDHSIPFRIWREYIDYFIPRNQQAGQKKSNKSSPAHILDLGVVSEFLYCLKQSHSKEITIMALRIAKDVFGARIFPRPLKYYERKAELEGLMAPFPTEFPRMKKRLQPNSYSIVQLIEAFTKLGMQDEALSFYDHAVKLYPKMAGIGFVRSRVAVLYGQAGSFDQLVAYMNETRSMGLTTSTHAITQLLHQYELSGEWDKSQCIFNLHVEEMKAAGSSVSVTLMDKLFKTAMLQERYSEVHDIHNSVKSFLDSDSLRKEKLEFKVATVADKLGSVTGSVEL
jgi:tetratricopeptide (TPR) repeat protein